MACSLCAPSHALRHACLWGRRAPACLQIYSHVCAQLLPTPSRSHYTFNLRDVSKVFQGILTIRPAQCGPDPRVTLVRLWVHEHMRVYHDR